MLNKINTSLLAFVVLSSTTLYGASPILTSTDVVSVNEDSLYTYDLTSSDADNDTVSITATTKPAWLNISSINAPANYIVAPNFTIDAGLDITNYTVDIGQNFFSRRHA